MPLAIQTKIQLYWISWIEFNPNDKSIELRHDSWLWLDENSTIWIEKQILPCFSSLLPSTKKRFLEVEKLSPRTLCPVFPYSVVARTEFSNWLSLNMLGSWAKWSSARSGAHATLFYTDGNQILLAISILRCRSYYKACSSGSLFTPLSGYLSKARHNVRTYCKHAWWCLLIKMRQLHNMNCSEAKQESACIDRKTQEKALKCWYEK